MSVGFFIIMFWTAFSWTPFSTSYHVIMMTSAADTEQIGFHEVDYVSARKLKTSYLNSDHKEYDSKRKSQSLFDGVKTKLSTISLTSITNGFKNVYLPSGYPLSVPPEYTQFQIWNVIQDLCSYLRGIMATRAILEGFGVGRSDITSVQATLNWVIRDGASMLGGLIFTALSSGTFGQNSKSWRLFADYINNVGITIDLLAPMSRKYFLHLICLSSLCKALCGIAAGASNSVISEHWGSLHGNIAEVNSKNGAQHTLVSIIGLVLSFPFTKFTSQLPSITWIVYTSLTLIHMISNYKAVRCLRLRSINLSRGTILVKSYLNAIFESNELLSNQVKKSIESHRFNNNDINTIIDILNQKNDLFSCKYVASIEPILKLLLPSLKVDESFAITYGNAYSIKLWVSPSHILETTKSLDENTNLNVMKLFSEKMNRQTRSSNSRKFIILNLGKQFIICFRNDCTSQDQLHALFEACFCAKCIEHGIFNSKDNNNDNFNNEQFINTINKHYEIFEKRIIENNWDF